MIRCILACDLKDGIVVRGVKGDRDRYRPVSESSLIAASSSPLDVISSLTPKETYIADLDRIMGRGDNLEVIRSLSDITTTMADTGISSVGEYERTCTAADYAVLGTETMPLPAIEKCQGSRTIVSLDMRNGEMVFGHPGEELSVLDTIDRMNSLELNSIILLDMKRVGSGEGIDVRLVEDAVSRSAHDVIIGGGVRDMEDLDTLKRLGVKGAIIASAVHFGKVPARVLRG